MVWNDMTKFVLLFLKQKKWDHQCHMAYACGVRAHQLSEARTKWSHALILIGPLLSCHWLLRFLIFLYHPNYLESIIS